MSKQRNRHSIRGIEVQKWDPRALRDKSPPDEDDRSISATECVEREFRKAHTNKTHLEPAQQTK